MLMNDTATGKATRDAASLQNDLARRLGLKHISIRNKKKSNNISGSISANQTQQSHAAASCPRCGNESTNISCSNCGHVNDNNSTSSIIHSINIHGRRSINPISSTDIFSDWSSVEHSILHRKDVNCPICMQPFADGHEVLLSCSHIFHRPCLASFEKITKMKKCPICRSVGYQKKITHEGSRAYEQSCVEKIQKLWRGYQAREKYYILKKDLYDRGLGNPMLRKIFYAREMKNLSHEVRQEGLAITGEAAIVLDMSAQSLRNGRNLDDEFEEMLRLRMKRIEDEAGRYGLADYDDREEADDGEVITEEQWEGKLSLSLSRGQRECAICMTALTTAVAEYRASAARRRAVLLSCSHAFHDKCIAMLELLVNDEGVSASLKCPVCRGSYQKRLLALDNAHFI